jgi:hypothetical protein
MPQTVRSEATVQYALDRWQRLRVRGPRDPVSGLRPVRILNGTVTTDRRNRLVYQVQTPPGEVTPPEHGGDGRAAARGGPPPARGASEGPRRYVFDGTWSLTRRHDLKLALHQTDQVPQHTLFLKGELLEATAHAVTVALWRMRSDGRRTSERLSLRGRWQADARNRLTFLVEKATGAPDRLTFQGGWTVGERHTLLYRYERRALPRQAAVTHTLRFEGAWDVLRAGRLVYRVEGSDDSAFDFRASLQTPSLSARDGRLVYQVGIGVSRSHTRTQRITLFGAWKLNRDLSVAFEIPYADGRAQAITFSGTVAVSRRDALTVELATRRGERLDLALTFSRTLVPDARLFLRLRQEAQERAVLGGVQVRF